MQSSSDALNPEIPTRDRLDATMTQSKSTERVRKVKTDQDKLRQSITIGKPQAEIYSFWRNFENLPRFMKDLVAVEVLSPTKSRWKMRLENGTSAEWEAAITGEEADTFISWQSLDGATASSSGTVWFEPAPRQSTIVRLEINYSIPGGKLSEWAMFFSGEDPETLTSTNLKRLKALLETGEVPTVEGQTSGREELQ